MKNMVTYTYLADLSCDIAEEWVENEIPGDIAECIKDEFRTIERMSDEDACDLYKVNSKSDAFECCLEAYHEECLRMSYEDFLDELVYRNIISPSFLENYRERRTQLSSKKSDSEYMMNVVTSFFDNVYSARKFAF